MVAAPWYQYGQINNYGSYPDPEGNFPKPDVNVLAPSGTPITALGSGVVSGINSPLGTVPSWGQVVTVKLDSPYNSVATHMAYLHLGSVQPGLSVGKRVNFGDTLGYAGGSVSGASTGFAFYNGDYYGYGPSWSQYVGSSQLDPTQFLSHVQEAQGVANSLGIGGGDSLTQLLNNNIQQAANNADSSKPNTFLGFDWTRFIDAGLLFIVGVILLIVGIMLLANKMGVTGAVEKAAIAA